MGDVLGWRRKFGAIGPSTNTVVQPDYDAMRPAGVTNHYSRIFTPNARLTNETFRAGVSVISDNVMDAVKSVMTCGPDYLIMAHVGDHLLRRGQGGADAFVRQHRGDRGRRHQRRQPLDHGGAHAYGGVRRIAILSPYWPVMNEAVIGYFTDMGFSVVRDIAMQCPSWTAIAEVTPQQCRHALRKLDGDDVDALVAGRHESLDGASRGCRRAVARQARDRHQHGHLLACACAPTASTTVGGLRPPARGILGREPMNWRLR